MRQNDELTRIKAKIKAMSEKTIENGCSEHEAMAAAAFVGRLLIQYNLSMEEIDVREEPCITVARKRKGKRAHPLDYTLVSLAAFCDCKVWTNTEFAGWSQRYDRKTRTWKRTAKMARNGFSLFGHESDIALALYLYDVIEAALATELKGFKKSAVYTDARVASRKSASVSFAHGYATRVSERLRAMKATRDKEMEEVVAAAASPAGSKTGTALIVLKGQIIEEEFDKLGVKLRTLSSSKSIRDDLAYYHGDAAGGRVNLNRPVEDNRDIAGLIG